MSGQAGAAGVKRLAQGANVLVSGASFAGLSTAYWMNRLGYKVTVVEVAKVLKKGGTPVDIREGTIDIVRRMGLHDAIHSNRLPARVTEFKNFDDTTEVVGSGHPDGYEIERNVLLELQFNAVRGDVEFMFGRSIIHLDERQDDINVTFDDGSRRSFALVFGCDGNHSLVRKLWFGPETQYSHFLGQYFSITIVNKLLIKNNTTQIFNGPGKSMMLNSYNDKTDIVFCFHSETEIPYDYRDLEAQRRIILEQFTGLGRTSAGLLNEMENCEGFYFDKMCQIKMPSWTKGRVALVGDAAYCASPAAGMGGSLAIVGATSLADAFRTHGEDFAAAFRAYNKTLRPFIEEVQSNAVDFGLEMFAPRTEEAIRNRNRQLTLAS